MNYYQLRCKSRDYSDYTFEPFNEYSAHRPLEPSIIKMFDPIKYHLFDGDIVEFIQPNTNPTMRMISSPVRNSKALYGTLILKGNRTFGKVNGRHLYQCIPNNPNLPVFLIPYSIQSEYSKSLVNCYVEFSTIEWFNKHPLGILTHVFGQVSNYSAFTQYSLKSRGLLNSISPFSNFIRSKFNPSSQINSFMNSATTEQIHKGFMEDRRDSFVISIDPSGCVDIDDAFSIHKSDSTLTLSVYISNVPFVIDSLECWKFVSDRISSIYLPDSRIPMIPSELSDNICSLREGVPRFALAFDFSIIIDSTYESSSTYSISYPTSAIPCIIKVDKNYNYDDVSLPTLACFQDACYFIHSATNKEINDSHDVVEWMMIETNKWVANWCIANSTGILRGTSTSSIISNTTAAASSSDSSPTSELLHPPQSLLETTPPDFHRFINSWISGNSRGIGVIGSGKYSLVPSEHFSDYSIPFHYEIGAYYTHASSPIRRMVDLINLTLLQMSNGYMSFYSKEFVSAWLTPDNIDFIQSQSRHIKHVQNNCQLMWILSNAIESSASREKLTHTLYDGVIISKEKEIKHGENGFNYSVFLFKFKHVFHYWSSDSLPIWKKTTFNFFIFEDKDRITDKLRLKHTMTDL